METAQISYSKTFVVENQESKQSQIIPYIIPPYQGTVDIKHIFQNIQNINNKHFKIYSPQENQYIPFEEICLQPFMIPYKYLQLQIIMIKYSQDEGRMLEEGSNQEQQTKKQRSKQRTIGQVIQVVAKWRNLHSTIQNGKRTNLQEAAKIVGISKKSLDDYYYQLRVGQKHQFDFNAHLQDKIGFLRAFIKQKEPERKNKQKNAKHPKKLKIIQEFQRLNLSQEAFNSKEQKEYKPQMNKKQEEISNNQDLASLSQVGLFWKSPYQQINHQSLIDCQKNYLQHFHFDKQEDDPYFMFAQRNSDSDNSSQNIFNFGF